MEDSVTLRLTIWKERKMRQVKVRNIEIGAGIPKICVPIAGVTDEEIMAAAEAVRDSAADLAEWRAAW